MINKKIALLVAILTYSSQQLAVSVQEFEATVKDFKKQYNIKSLNKEVFAAEGHHLREFMKTPLISEFLTREISQKDLSSKYEDALFSKSPLFHKLKTLQASGQKTKYLDPVFFQQIKLLKDSCPAPIKLEYAGNIFDTRDSIDVLSGNNDTLYNVALYPIFETSLLIVLLQENNMPQQSFLLSSNSYFSDNIDKNINPVELGLNKRINDFHFNYDYYTITEKEEGINAKETEKLNQKKQQIKEMKQEYPYLGEKISFIEYPLDIPKGASPSLCTVLFTKAAIELLQENPTLLHSLGHQKIKSVLLNGIKSRLPFYNAQNNLLQDKHIVTMLNNCAWQARRTYLLGFIKNS